jgi:hypothetical protein
MNAKNTIFTADAMRNARLMLSRMLPMAESAGAGFNAVISLRDVPPSGNPNL